MNGTAGRTTRARLAALTSLGALLAFAAPLAAQPRIEGPSARPSWRVGASVVTQSRFSSDLNGPRVRGEPALALEGGVAFRLLDVLGLRTAASLALRARRPRATVEELADSIGPARSAGRVTLLDVQARLEQEADGILGYYAGVGTTWVRGPRDVAPFRLAGGHGFRRAAEVGASLRVARRPLWLTGAAQLFDLGTDRGTLQRGPVARFAVGLRHGR